MLFHIYILILILNLIQIFIRNQYELKKPLLSISLKLYIYQKIRECKAKNQNFLYFFKNFHYFIKSQFYYRNIYIKQIKIVV